MSTTTTEFGITLEGEDLAFARKLIGRLVVGKANILTERHACVDFLEEFGELQRLCGVAQVLSDLDEYPYDDGQARPLNETEFAILLLQAENVASRDVSADFDGAGMVAFSEEAKVFKAHLIEQFGPAARAIRRDG